MEITNEQKFKIYTDTLVQVEEYQVGICSQLLQSCHSMFGPSNIIYNYAFLTEHFPEFTDQRPPEKNKDDYWWPVYHRKVRIDLLKLLIQKYAPNDQGETQNS